jgi:hypothetical protein
MLSLFLFGFFQIVGGTRRTASRRYSQTGIIQGFNRISL